MTIINNINAILLQCFINIKQSNGQLINAIIVVNLSYQCSNTLEHPVARKVSLLLEKRPMIALIDPCQNFSSQINIQNIYYFSYVEKKKQ